MKLESILPRALGDSDSDCASIFTSLVMAAHFERTRARALGWRGVRPCASSHPAWTYRVAGSENVFGLRFDGETRDETPGRVPCLRGYFSLYVFPPAQSPLLDVFPLDALRFALSPDYEHAVREFSGSERELLPFLLGQLRLDVSLAGDALALTLEAPARHRVIAADGIAAEDGWLVRPGEPECDVPAFSLFLRLFAVLACTAEQALGEKAAVSRGAAAVARRLFHADGSMEDADEKEYLLNIAAAFGPSLALDGERLRLLQGIPAKHRPEELEKLDRPVLHVLTGFLGAGKTTFLRRWLDFLHGRERYTGVIQNEFGKVELDAALMKGDTLVEALDEGCVCCSLADSLRPGLERIIAAMPAEQFVLETTGLANPDNIMEALGGLRDLVEPGLVITVADALDLAGKGRENEHPEDSGIRQAQLRRADVIILNKSEMISSEALEALAGRLRALNGKALILPAHYGSIPFAELDAWIDAHGKTRLPSHAPRLAHMGERAVTHADEGFEAKALTFEGPVSAEDLEAVLRDAGPGLCRAKGIISIAGQGACVVQYAAGQLEITPAPGEETSDLAIIGSGLRI